MTPVSSNKAFYSGPSHTGPTGGSGHSEGTILTVILPPQNYLSASRQLLSFSVTFKVIQEQINKTNVEIFTILTI